MFDPNRNTKVAGYIFNEFKFSETTKAQIAGRIEHANLSGTTPAFIPDVFDVNADPTAIGPATQRNLNFTPKSASTRPDPESSVESGRAASPVNTSSARPNPPNCSPAARTMRPRLSISAIPISASKPPNRSKSDCGRATGPLRFELTGYYTKFDGFIFRRLNGNTCEDGVCQIGPGLELNQAIYSQRDATFRGGEFQFQYDVLPVWNGLFGIEGQYDIVRATFEDGTNVPRIPPQRLGGGVFYRDIELADARQPAARLRPERRRSDRRDADRRLQPA